MSKQRQPGRGANQTRVTFAITLTGLMLGAALPASRAQAQDGTGQDIQQGTNGGQARAGRGQGRGGFGQGGPGGFAGRQPTLSGTVTGGDRAAGTITITPAFGGTAQTIKVSPTTKYAAQSLVAAGALRVGDEVQVQGVPTGITTTSITAGQMPDFLRPGGSSAGGRNGGAAGAGADANGRNAQAGNGANQDPTQAPPQAFASATGRVIATSPLTIELSNSVSIILKVSGDTKVTKINTATFDSLKVGDMLLAVGQADAAGVFTATGIGVNMNQGGFGRGAFGGRSGFGGQGGFGPGGQGGGQGRRGGRGGSGQTGAGGAGSN